MLCIFLHSFTSLSSRVLQLIQQTSGEPTTLHHEERIRFLQEEGASSSSDRQHHVVLDAQLATFCGPSGMSDMKNVMMKDHVEDKKPALGTLLGSSAPSSPLSPSSSEASSLTPSCMDK
ncbi:hypothetical protein ILYODFUR_007094 [Ilyodon furcidens]|uniref:Uncharacterized protein n=1 Tax=Ilyodon furcidens TaxID=33524 RepID=A0ABV0US11_9TELE